MANYDREVAHVRFGVSRTDPAMIDAGLRTYMLHVYNYMVLGLAITGLCAWGIYALSVTHDPAAAAKIVHGGIETSARIGDGYLTPLGQAVFFGPMRWIIMLSPLVIVFALSFGAELVPPPAAQLLFWLFAALMGLSLGAIFLVFTHTSIVRVFFITAASFGALSLWGYTTRRDLGGVGSFLIIGLFGVVIGSVVNLFLGSTTLQWMISLVGVFVFAGLTAWDTQRLKSEYLYGALHGESADRAAIMGALSLYLNFINLFTLLLQLLGQRQD